MILVKIKDYRHKECIQYLKDTVSIYKAFDLKKFKLDGFGSIVPTQKFIAHK